MTEHPNARLVRRGFASFAKGDLEALREWMTDEVVWHEPGRSPLGGDYKGPSEVFSSSSRSSANAVTVPSRSRSSRYSRARNERW